MTHRSEQAATYDFLYDDVDHSLTLRDKKTGNLAFGIKSFEKSNPFKSLQYNNYYTMLIITGGTGALDSNFSTASFAATGLCFFHPISRLQSRMT